RTALLLACLITLIVNADTLTAVHVLWTNPVARAEAVSIAEKKSKEPPPSVEYENPSDPTASALKKAPASPEEGLSDDQRKLLGELTGWQKDWDTLKSKSGSDWWTALAGIIGGHLLGWILTALAVSLGAPFWFDTLNRFMNIRNAGRAPNEPRDKGNPAATPNPPAPQPGKA
ncbi:MAG: hypothetical protein HY248_02585, partial [Fimbriimonas ginsengisoli]|nr:hypothetical protein [Fimbriimonas ginsengisoli]